MVQAKPKDTITTWDTETVQIMVQGCFAKYGDHPGYYHRFNRSSANNHRLVVDSNTLLIKSSLSNLWETDQSCIPVLSIFPHLTLPYMYRSPTEASGQQD